MSTSVGSIVHFGGTGETRGREKPKLIIEHFQSTIGILEIPITVLAGRFI